MYFFTALSCWGYINFECLGVIFWDDNAARSSTIMKFIGFMILVIANLLQAYCIAKHSTDLTTDLKTDQLLYFKWIVAAPSCGVGVCCCRKMLKCLITLNFLLFTSILIWSLIPILILAFVNPVQTLAVVLTISFLFMAVLALYFLHKGVNTGGVLEFILALAPGSILTIAAWFSKKILAQFEGGENGGLHTHNYHQRGGEYRSHAQ